jgi:RNA-directed DNA polymerase
MDMTKEVKPAEVAAKPTQAGDIRSRWSWVEPTMWTDGMLAALENGVKGGKWYSLIDKVWLPRNLEMGFQKVRKNHGAAGVDGMGINRFGGNLSDEITRLSRSLKEGTYAPLAVKRTWIPKPGSKEKRPLGIPAVRDRTVQTTVRNVMEPIFERKFSDNSYGFRPGRSCKDALRKVDVLLKSGYKWVVDADIKGYFDAIPHDKLIQLVGEEIADGHFLELIRKYLEAKVMDGLSEWTPESGTPQGSVASPLLANIYLNPFDHHMEGKGFKTIRYADDFVVMCKTKTEAETALETIQDWMNQAELTLHPEKTRIVDAGAGDSFEFLGYRFEKGERWPRKKSLDKFKNKVREITKRSNGYSLDAIIAKLNPCLRGWFNYFKHSRKFIFKALDGWIRRRLRSILRKRSKRKGCARGWDNQRWPNKFFAEHGLFSLTVAHSEAVGLNIMR